MSIYLLLEGLISFLNLSVVWAVTYITQANAIAWSVPTTPPSPHGKGDFFWLKNNVKNHINKQEHYHSPLRQGKMSIIDPIGLVH